MEKYRGVDYLDIERLLSDEEKLGRDSARDILGANYRKTIP